MLFGGQVSLAKADGFGRNLHQLIFIDEFQRLFE
jgi:hypothetical protein